MFYQNNIDQELRFGDVVQGYVLSATNIEKPMLNGQKDYSIEVNHPKYAVILTPCCSIKNKLITLSPLIQIYPYFCNNPFFLEDFTRINRKLKPEQSLPPDVWNTLKQDEKQNKIDEGDSYTFLELFIYEKNDIFQMYTLNRKEGNKETNYYMIDFRNIHKVNCQTLVNQKQAPLFSKCLQLTINTRIELRNKLAFYYGKIPKEDKVTED